MNRAPFVYIVESPSSADLFEGRSEGDALSKSLGLLGIGHEYVMATTIDVFRACFDFSPGSRLLRAIERHGMAAPIIHLSMHGDARGIQLHDGTYLTWNEVRQVLDRLNHSAPLGLMLCFSTCSGAMGATMSRQPGAKPFFAHVGSFEDVQWSDALIGFTTFYHAMTQLATFTDALNRMRVASGHAAFSVMEGSIVQQHYLQQLRAPFPKWKAA